MGNSLLAVRDIDHKYIVVERSIKMKKYRIREYSPAWWLGLTLGMAAFITFMSLPSTIEFL